jgi:predicted transcriptional regulator
MKAWCHKYDIMPAKQITIRNVTSELDRRLKELAKRRNESVNSTLLYILRQVLDVNERRARLQRYVDWSEAEVAEFDALLAELREVDDDAWR